VKTKLMYMLIVFGLVPYVSADPVSKAGGSPALGSLPQESLVTSRFFLTPGANPAGDQRWQQAAAGSRVELDLDNFGHLQSLDRLSVGNLSVRLGTNREAEGQVVVSSEFAYPGSVFQSALHDGDANPRLGTNALTFDFSNPVGGFGLWIFDDNSQSNDSFRMTVEDANGDVWRSRVLESGNGFDPSVEGFIGVHSNVGIRRAVVQAGYWNGSKFLVHDTDFYVDCIQFVVPVPAAAILGAWGLMMVRRLTRSV
jgi:hypothetical protein